MTMITRQERTSPPLHSLQKPSQAMVLESKGFDGQGQQSPLPSGANHCRHSNPQQPKALLMPPQETTRRLQTNPVATLSLVGNWALSGASHPHGVSSSWIHAQPRAFGGKGKQPARDHRPTSPVQAPGLRSNPSRPTQGGAGHGKPPVALSARQNGVLMAGWPLARGEGGSSQQTSFTAC